MSKSGGPAPRHIELLEVLAAHDVDAVLVGGVAMQLHGRAHTTRDVDVVVAVDERNARRIDAALQALQARPGGTSERGSHFATRLGPLELLNTTSGVGGYDGWIERAAAMRLPSGAQVRVAAWEDIQRNKLAAGRGKDLEHLELGQAATRAAAQTPTERAEALLGPEPADAARGQRWRAARVLATRYCEDFSVIGTEPLGPRPVVGGQVEQWERLHRLAATVRESAADGPQAAAQLAARSFGAPAGSTRPPGAEAPEPRSPTAQARGAARGEGLGR